MHMLRRAAPLLAILAAGACDRSEADAPAAQIDTTNTDDLDGLSSEQVEAKAEALTPEQAAARGIAVDTTIHVENLSGPDSAGAPAEGGRTASPPATTAAPRDSGQ